MSATAAISLSSASYAWRTCWASSRVVVARPNRLAEPDDHVQPLAAVEQRDGQQGPVAGEVLVRRVVGRDLEVVDDRRLAGVD
jgi:hypothetical protein